MADAPTPSIDVRRLTKRYGSLTAIDGLTFQVARGEIVGFLGPNGAGKSTTMRILSGLTRADSGEAWVAGQAVATQGREVRKRLGFMPENNPLPEDLRVEEYLRFRARLKDLPPRRRRERVEVVLDLCDLTRRNRRKLIGTLSKGLRQRVGVADALLAEPEVAILDEPTIGLDPHQIMMMRNVLQSLRGRSTVVVSSHILSEIEQVCDRVIIINEGRIVACGTHADLTREFAPRTRYSLRLQGPAEALPARLATVAPDLEVMERGEADAAGWWFCVVENPGNSDYGEDLLRAFAGTDGWRVAGLERRAPTLEDIFVAATRRVWDQAQIAPAPAAVERGAA